MSGTKAVLRYGRIGPQKVRDIIPLIAGKDARVALGILANVRRRGASILMKLIRSALTNAEANEIKGKQPAPRFYLEKVIVDGGPAAKRFRAAAMGRSTSIKKRTSHISVILRNKENGSKS